MVELLVQDLEFRYGSRLVLENINLSLREGQLLSLVGTNGSGKTTLLKCISGLLAPIHGRILPNGKDIGSFRRRELARIIGYVPQMGTGWFPATVFDTILLGRRPYLDWKPAAEDIQSVSENIERLGLGEMVLRDVNELSGGERQKVVIGRAVAQDAKVLLLDEPSNHLDLKHQLQVMQLVRQLVDEKGISAVVTTHDLNLAAQYSDQIIMLRRGQVFASGEANIITPESIREVYGIEAWVKTEFDRPYVVPRYSLQG